MKTSDAVNGEVQKEREEEKNLSQFDVTENFLERNSNPYMMAETKEKTKVVDASDQNVPGLMFFSLSSFSLFSSFVKDK